VLRPKGAHRREKKEAGARSPLEFFSFLENLGPLLALGSNNKFSNKIIAKMLHLSTETYNYEQVSKIFRQILAETCLKMVYFGTGSTSFLQSRQTL